MNEVKNDVIVFDTDAWKKDLPAIRKKIEIFPLVPETHPALKMRLPEFDFTNTDVNASDFASSLVETCKKHNGLGLSANQCGYNYRVFVMGSGDEYVAFFNPKILSQSEDTSKMEEGCLSYMDLFLNIERPNVIEVEYQDFTGAVKTAKFAGLTARCFQHELDHMNGIVYTMHVKPLAMQMAMKKRSKLADKRRKIQQQMINKVKEKFNVNRF
jgi:peptide deformylase